MPKKQVKEVRKPGRPSKYDPDLGAELVELAEQGYSFNRFCAKNNIPHSTFYLWRDTYPEFYEACCLASVKFEDYLDNIYKTQAESTQKYANNRQLDAYAAANCKKYKREMAVHNETTNNTLIYNNKTMSYKEILENLKELNKELNLEGLIITNEQELIEQSKPGEAEES